MYSAESTDITLNTVTPYTVFVNLKNEDTSHRESPETPEIFQW